MEMLSHPYGFLYRLAHELIGARRGRVCGKSVGDGTVVPRMTRNLTQLSLKEIHEQYGGPDAAISGQLLRQLQRDPRAGVRKLYQALAKRSDQQRKERLRL